MKKKQFYAKEYAEEAQKKVDDRLRKVLVIFSNRDCNRILDIGCGDGAFSVLLGEATNANEVYGIEISSEGVEKAISKGVKALQLDIDEQDFPFEDDFFDAIFAGEIIEHLYDPDHFLDEVYRTLKRSGLCIVTTPNLASWYNRIVLLLGFQPYLTEVSLRHNVGKLKPGGSGTSGHIRPFSYRFQ